MKTDAQRFPADGRGVLCGHNFPPRQCPYAKCGYREALEHASRLEERLEGIEYTEQLAKDTYREMRERLEQCEAFLKDMIDIPTGTNEFYETCAKAREFLGDDAARAAVEEK